MICEILQERGAIGKENAMTTATLTELTGLCPRVIRQRVNNERRGMRFILSTFKRNGGYYIPVNNEEICEFIERGEKECRRKYEWLNSWKKAVETQKGGAGLFDEEAGQ